jgi:hypothetical protein
VIATLAVRTGIDPLALRDVAVADPDLLGELVDASTTWGPELELAASNVEVTHELLRTVLALAGAKTIPRPLAIPRDRKLQRRPPPRVSIAELAAMTDRTIRSVET